MSRAAPGFDVRQIGIVLLVVMLAACGGPAGDNGDPQPEPLTLSVTGPETAVAGSPIALQAEVAGALAASAVISWSATAGTFDPDLGPEATWTAPATPGEHTITAVAAAGASSETATHVVQVTAQSDDPADPGAPGDPDPGAPGGPDDPDDSEPLTISISGASNAIEGESVSLNATVSGDGATADNVAWSAEYGTFSTQSGAATSWTAPEESDSFTILATITVGDASETAEHHIVVSEPLGIRIYDGDRNVVAGKETWLEAYFTGETDASKDDVSWSATGGDLYLHPEDGVRWTAPESPGESFTVTASIMIDGQLFSDDVTLTVVEPPPVVEIQAQSNAYFGEAVTLTATVNGEPPGEGVTIIWSTLSFGEFEQTTGESVTWIAPVENLSRDIQARIQGSPPAQATRHRMNVSICGGNGAMNSPTHPCLLHNVLQLQAIGTTSNLDGYFALAGHIDASETELWNGGAGFIPIGSAVTGSWFTGSVDGADYIISNLFINRPTESDVGLFSTIYDGGEISNLRLEDVNVTGQSAVGGLAGRLNHRSAVVDRSSVSGTITAVGNADHVQASAGGLVGINNGLISNARITANVTGHGWSTGGLVGQNSGGTIESSHSTATVMGLDRVSGDQNSGNRVGGLAGTNTGSITDSWSGASVTGTGSEIGGLVGQMSNAAGSDVALISGSYSSTAATVEGYDAVGGLIGRVQSGEVRQSYSQAATVTANRFTVSIAVAGGLIGSLGANAVVDETYSVSAVTPAASNTGGLIGFSTSGTVTRSFWATDLSGQSTSAGGTEAAGSEMRSTAIFRAAGWKFGLEETWMRPTAPPADNSFPDLNSNRRPTAVLP